MFSFSVHMKSKPVWLKEEKLAFNPDYKIECDYRSLFLNSYILGNTRLIEFIPLRKISSFLFFFRYLFLGIVLLIFNEKTKKIYCWFNNNRRGCSNINRLNRILIYKNGVLTFISFSFLTLLHHLLARWKSSIIRDTNE